jgi:hypothetical protein
MILVAKTANKYKGMALFSELNRQSRICASPTEASDVFVWSPY